MKSSGGGEQGFLEWSLEATGPVDTTRAEHLSSGICGRTQSLRPTIHRAPCGYSAGHSRLAAQGLGQRKPSCPRSCTLPRESEHPKNGQCGGVTVKGAPQSSLCDGPRPPLPLLPLPSATLIPHELRPQGTPQPSQPQGPRQGPGLGQLLKRPLLHPQPVCWWPPLPQPRHRVRVRPTRP